MMNFADRVRMSVEQSADLGYYPARFAAMLRSQPAVNVAVAMVSSGELQHGLRRLARMGRLDLSLEALMLQYPDLFSAAILECARWRLEQLK